MIDLHLHSTYSDGTMTPAELVRLAAGLGLSAVAITDHDTVSGTEEALSEGTRCSLEVVPGLEISVEYKGMNLHLLGYFFDWRNGRLVETLEMLQTSREVRNKKIVSKFQEMGIDLSADELQDEAGEGVAGRPHFARLLVKKNIVKTTEQAFARYLKAGRCAYVSRFVLEIREAIEILHEAGEFAVVAHPLQIPCSMSELSGILRELKHLGIDGLETYYPTQRGDAFKKIRALAQQYQLLETGGSDYHGDTRKGTSIAGASKNFLVPDEIMNTLRKQKERIDQNR